MLHPSYLELMDVVNEGADQDSRLVNSRYSIVMATAKRARQIVDGSQPKSTARADNALSIAVQELYEGKVKIISDEKEQDN
ncbi:MAG: DNA-directed RNA polymerase subunit omega [Lachnospiraceae bacterium]|nr:DNA-directed RNA polymerase subunit omega [Lachnospiraceae bacterium]MCD7863987.1 DNA-directed RNA polymerase subunit omega [Lachnospiraceae bacterium]